MDTLLNLGLIGSFVIVLSAVQHWRLTPRPPEPVLVRRMDDIDAEFVRITKREWQRDR